MQPISRGDRGLAVSDVQKRLHDLGYSPPGLDLEMRDLRFGEATEEAVRRFQDSRGLRPDGLVDEVTWRELVEASFRLGDRFLYLRVPPFRGDDVRELQSCLNRLGFNAGREDGIFGPDTDRALRAFQHDMGLPADGIAGTSTISCLQRLRHAMKETSVAVVHETLRDGEDRGLAERTVLLDIDLEPPRSAEELRLASRHLDEKGISTILTGGPDAPMPESQRAQLANSRGVDAVIGFRTGDSDSVRFFYFGSRGYFSPRGRRLADLLRLETESSLGKTLPPPESRSYPLLRETRMPCVIVEWPPGLEIPAGYTISLARAICGYFLPPDDRRESVTPRE